MVSISKSTWSKIHDVLLSISSIHDITDLNHQIMAVLSGLIPYENSGIFIELDDELKPTIVEGNSIRIENKWSDSFNEYYYKMGVFPDLDRNTFSSDFRNERMYGKNEYVNDFITPQGIYSSAGLIVTRPGNIPSHFLVLNRRKSERMFTPEELTALQIIQPHISNHYYIVQQLEQFRKMPILLSELEMNNRVISRRESEIIYLLLRRYKPIEIAKQLKISILTVRKHIQNIYEKLEVTDRHQLFQKIKLDFRNS